MKLLIRTEHAPFVPINNMFQFSACESTTTYVIVDAHALHRTNFVNCNDIVTHIQFQLGALPV